MQTYSDAHLEHYADRFIALRLARHGINLVQYLANIDRFERLALEPEPLLPAQQAAALKLWQQQDTGLDAPSATASQEEWQDWRELVAGWREETTAQERALAHLPRRNGAIVEPLAHHRYPRSAACNFTRRNA
jgi:hypothetical protein